MNIFGTNDVVSARAIMMGREIMNIRICGVCSMESLLRRLRQELGNVFGLVTINIRNLTQGWTQSRAYRLV